MSDKKDILYNNQAIIVSRHKDHWILKFPDGSNEKLYYNINAEKDGVWMWESGRIDDASLSIGELIGRSD